MSAQKNHHSLKNGWAENKNPQTPVFQFKNEHTTIMNAAQLHLLMNHLPSIGQMVGFAVFLFGVFSKKDLLQKTGAWIILIAALFVIPVNLSGEEAEEFIEDMPGITHSIIHEHEEAAESAFILTLISGAIALGYIVVNRWKPRLNMLFRICLLLACSASLLLLINASHKGGMIRHPELINANSGGQTSSDHIEKDDDHETEEHE